MFSFCKHNVLICHTFRLVLDKFIEVSIHGDLDVAKALGQTSTALGASLHSLLCIVTRCLLYLTLRVSCLY